MPGRGGTVGGGVRDQDDGRGALVLGTATGSDSAQGLQGVDGSWVAGGAHADTAWEGRRGDTTLGIRGPQEATTYIQNGIYDLRGTAELSN